MLLIGTFAFTKAQPPSITSFLPTTVCQGDTVSITGTNFTGATTVRLGTLLASGFVVNSTTSITAIVANTSATGTVRVTTPAGTATGAGNLTILPAPTPLLTDVSPGRDIDFTNCDGNSNYQITVRNNSTVSGTGNLYSINWGDGPTVPLPTDWPVGSQLSHTYVGQGYFDMVLTITPPNGCKKSFTKRFYQGVPPRASWYTDTLTPPVGCAPVFVNFIIGTPWQNNSLGTTYVINFGDGTPPVTLQHPLNLTNTPHVIPHTYNTSSCPGTSFTATLDVINACSPTPTRYTQNQIIIRKAPVADFNLSSTCAGNVCFTNLTKNGFSGTSCNTATSFLWEFEDGTTSNSQTPPCRNYAPGTYTVKLIASNNGCGSDTQTKQFTINSTPAPGTVRSNGPLCAGDTLKLFADTVAGATYAWTGPGGFTSSQQNPVRPNATTAMSGTYQVRITVNGCTSAPATVAVAVNARPSLPAVTAAVNYCQFSTAVPLAATATSGNTLLWYSSATGGTGNPVAPTLSTTELGDTTFYVSQISSATQCESNRAAITVTIRPVPAISSVDFTHPATCSSPTGSLTLNGLTPGTSYSVSYSKNGGAPVVVNRTANNSSIIVISNLSAGSYDNISVMLNGCTSNKVGPVVLSDPNPPATPIVRGFSPICTGDTLQLCTDAVSGAVYSWTGPGFSSTQPCPVRLNAETAMSGTYAVTVSVNGCTSAPGSVNVVVRDKPAKPAITCPLPVAYCLNAAASPLCATASADNHLVWCTLPQPGVCSTTAPIPPTGVAQTICYSVYQQSDTSGCKSDTAMICVVVSSLVTNNTIKGDTTLCGACQLPGTFAPAQAIGGGNGTYAYQWQQSIDGGNSWTDVAAQPSGTNAAYTPAPVCVTTLFRRLVSSGSCADTSNVVRVGIGGLENIDITAADTICAGERPAVLTGADDTTYTYQWQQSADSIIWTDTIGETHADYHPPALTATTYYRRRAASGSCFGFSNTVKITVYNKPVAGIIRPVDTTVCIGSSAVVTAGSITGTIKAWQLQRPLYTGAWFDTTVTEITLLIPNLQDSVGVRLIVVSDGFGRGCDLADTGQITAVRIAEKTIGGTTGPDATVCRGGNSGTITLSGHTGRVVQWEISENNGLTWAAVSDTAASLTYTDLMNTTWYRALISSGGCPDVYSDTTIITVVRSVTAADAGTAQWHCNINAVLLNANQPLVGTGVWNNLSPTGVITDPTSPNTTVTGLQPGVYQFAWTISGSGRCAGSTDIVRVRIWPPATVANAGRDTVTLCDFTTARTISLQANPAQSFETARWSVLSGPGGSSFSDDRSPYSSFTFSQPGVYTLQWQIANDSTGGCQPTEDVVTVMVFEKPEAGIVQPASTTVCAGDSVLLTYAPVRGMIAKWQINYTPANAFSWQDVGVTAPIFTVRNVQRSFAARVVVVTSGATPNCLATDTSRPVTVTVTAVPQLAIQASPSLVLQQPEYTFTFNETSPANPAYQFVWRLGDRPEQTRNGKEITYTYGDTGSYNVKLLVTDFSTGCKRMDSVTVKILYVPGYLYLPNALCVKCDRAELQQLLPLGKGLKQYRLRIYSKWGKLLFETTKLNPDGSPAEAWKPDFSNTALQQDAFMWVAEAVYINNTEWKGMVYPADPKRHVKSGFITIIK